MASSPRLTSQPAGSQTPPRMSPSQSPALTPTSPGERRPSGLLAGKKDVADFMIGKLLGEGAFARVFLVRAKDSGKDYAMKIMEKKFIIKEGKSKEVQMERRILSDISHPNIVRLFFSFHDKDRLYMVLDLCPGGELAKLVRYSRDERIRGNNRALSEDQARFYLSETISAVQHLHSAGILHRDLKPENVLIASNGHVKLTDFGTAKDLKASNVQAAPNGSELPRKDTFCGTAEYVSPEVLQDGVADIGADLWALGIMTHMLLVGRTPFLCESEFLTFQCILTYAGMQDKETDKLLAEDAEVNASVPKITPESLSFPETSNGSKLSKESLDLVRRLLDPDPKKRLGYAKADDLRSHGFFKGLDFSQLDKVVAPVLPYKTEYEAPNKDGGKQDWLMADEDDMLEEELMIELASKKKKPLQRKSTANSTASSGGGGIAGSGLERFLSPDENVLLDGAVSIASYGGFVSSRRHMVLTDKGRVVLIDPATQSVKEDMTVINSVVTVRANGKDFDITSPKKTLRLKDQYGNAGRWKEAIEKL